MIFSEDVGVIDGVGDGVGDSAGVYDGDGGGL